jgi:hypothetical protein
VPAPMAATTTTAASPAECACPRKIRTSRASWGRRSPSSVPSGTSRSAHPRSPTRRIDRTELASPQRLVRIPYSDKRRLRALAPLASSPPSWQVVLDLVLVGALSSDFMLRWSRVGTETVGMRRRGWGPAAPVGPATLQVSGASGISGGDADCCCLAPLCHPVCGRRYTPRDGGRHRVAAGAGSDEPRHAARARVSRLTPSASTVGRRRTELMP